MHWRFPWRTLLRCAIACLAMTVVVLGVRAALFHAPRGVDVAAAGVAGAMTYAAAIVLLGEISLTSLWRALTAVVR